MFISVHTLVMKGHVDNHVLHVHAYIIVPTMLTELYVHMYLYPLQYGYTALHLADMKGHTTCVERLLSTPGILVNIQIGVNKVHVCTLIKCSSPCTCTTRTRFAKNNYIFWIQQTLHCNFDVLSLSIYISKVCTCTCTYSKNDIYLV